VSLGARVKALRLERGWSQTELARDIVSTSYVSLIEAGRRVPERPVIEALAERLGCAVAYLETGVDVAAAQETELRLRFAELALANGDPVEAGERFGEIAAAESGAFRTRAVWGLARSEEAGGDLEAAIAHLESLIDGVRRGEDAGPGLTVLLMHQCRLYREAGDLSRSVEMGERALKEVHDLGLAGTDDEVRLASTLVAAHWERGDLLTARNLAEDVIARAEQNGSRRARGSAYWNASLVCEARGDLPRAVELAGRALAMFSEEVDERSLARLRTDCAWVLLRQDPPDVDRAEELLTRSYQALAAANIGTDLAYCETELARVDLHRGRPDQAAEHAAGTVPAARARLRRAGPGPARARAGVAAQGTHRRRPARVPARGRQPAGARRDAPGGRSVARDRGHPRGAGSSGGGARRLPGPGRLRRRAPGAAATGRARTRGQSRPGQDGDGLTAGQTQHPPGPPEFGSM
jgi:transcriptional regulator with XRE-family HTH domain